MSQIIIMTMNEETALSLKQAGFNQIGQSDNKWFFQNDESKIFFSQELPDVIYTNKLFV